MRWLLLTLLLLVSGSINAVAESGNDVAPVLYFFIAMHSEDPHHADTPNFTTDKLGYVSTRNAVLNFASIMTNHNVPWNWQSDWNFINGVKKYEIDTPDLSLLSVTANHNIVGYLHDVLGVEVDAHSHENDGYNYADVAYLISQTGVTPASVVGGHIWDPSVATYQDWPRFINGISGAKFPEAPVWQPRLLMGAGSPSHENDPTVTGIWKPASSNAFFTHDDSGTMLAIGNWQEDQTRLNELLRLLELGLLPTNHMWTAGLVVNESDLVVDPDYVTNTFLPTLERLVALRDSGRLQFMQLAESAQIWTNQFDSAGAVHIGATNYLTFSLNIQDFAHPDLSAALLNRLLDLHETNQVPVDIFLTTTMVDIFQTNYPALLTRLMTSPVVALSYHTRAPLPYRVGYDWLGLADMTTSEVYSNVLYYETHGLNLTNGEPTEASGGYSKYTSLLGYPPFMGGVASDAGLSSTVKQVFHDLGVKMFVEHGSASNLGDTTDGFYVKPEHIDLRLFEHVGEDVTNVLNTALADVFTNANVTPPYFVGVKMHDNDFFAVQSAWTKVYLDGGKRPPWDPTQTATLLTDEEQEAMWSLYENMVRYAASRRPELEIVNARGVLNLLGQPGPAGLVLSANSVPEASPVGTTIGSLSTWCTNGPVALSLTETAPQLVSLAGTTLTTASVYDYETAGQMYVRVRVTDTNGLIYEQPLLIQVSNITTDDDDGDGLTEAEEQLAGTNPLLSDFSLRLLSVTPGSGNISLTGSIAPGRTYYLQWAEDVNGPWNDVAEPVSITSGTNLNITLSDSGTGNLFFRLRQSE